jgi:hypothetical protein
MATKFSQLPLAGSLVGDETLIGLKPSGSESDEENVQITVEDLTQYVLNQDSNTGGGGGASTTQTGEMMCGFISSPSEKDYRIVLKAAHGGTITETTTRSASGTCTATFKINTTALGGTANSVSNSESSQSHASNNVFSAGDDIVITISSNSSCADMSFTIKYTAPSGYTQTGSGGALTITP